MTNWDDRKLRPRQCSVELPISEGMQRRFPPPVPQTAELTSEGYKKFKEVVGKIGDNEFAMAGYLQILYQKGELGYWERYLDSIVIDAMKAIVSGPKPKRNSTDPG